MIDFKVIDSDLKLGVIHLNLLVDLFEDVKDCPWYDSIEGLDFYRHYLVFLSDSFLNDFDNLIRSQHGIRLSRPALTVSEDSSIVT